MPGDVCAFCLGSAIVRRDGSARVLAGEWSTWAEMVVKFKPCVFCAAGEKESNLWDQMADMDKQLEKQRAATEGSTR